ncbi:MAG: protein translocase subunit SecF [Caldithrix sp.]|nr:protein translocase subunit SecF [Caldithrix sp.]
MRLLKNTNIGFVKTRKMGYIISSILIIASVVSLILHGGPRYNIDFTGGTLLHLKFDKPVKIQDMREALSTRGYGKAEIKHFGSENEVSIRSGIQYTTEELSTTMQQVIEQAMPNNNFVVQRVEKVGPQIGRELIMAAIKAIIWAMVLILLYVMWRFEFKFSIGAIAALFHDVIITLGLFSILDIEISAPIIAALLTIVGYSLNDTIVVFDRVRENVKSSKKKAFDIPGTVNQSINEVLSRTVVTSGTTLIVVLVLYFFGGEVLRTFAFALILGVLIGTYSSIYVASPIVVDWRTKKA